MSNHVTWTRSSFCADHACVEVAAMNDEIWLRDSKNTEAPAIRFSRDQWNRFLMTIQGNDAKSTWNDHSTGQ